MSTRANIIVKDSHDQLWFYRPYDGYPDGTLPTLNKFLDMVKKGKIRNNVSQAAGWLIIIGREEDAPLQEKYPDISAWKVGAYEPTTERRALDDYHNNDIDYLYTVDLVKLEISWKMVTKKEEGYY